MSATKKIAWVKMNGTLLGVPGQSFCLLPAATTKTTSTTSTLSDPKATAESSTITIIRSIECLIFRCVLLCVVYIGVLRINIYSVTSSTASTGHWSFTIGPSSVKSRHSKHLLIYMYFTYI